MNIDLTKGLTHAEMLKFCKKENPKCYLNGLARMARHCHWYAESQDTIQAVLEELEVDKMCAASINEMLSFVTAKDKNFRSVGDPDNE